MSVTDKDQIRQTVRERYASVANETGGGCCSSSSSCCSSNPEGSSQLGYSSEEILSVPDGANMGLGCGNPQAIAALRPGEVVVDLGSGGGFDCFLAAKKVGSTGKVIGIDMTPDMVSKARRNAEKGGFSNVEFRLGEIEYLPVADGAADIIMSNCVINLSPDKQQVFNETWRILKEGGRIAVSDIVALREMPDSLKNNRDALCGCISGAARNTDIETMLTSAGFSDILVELKPESRNFIKDWAPGSGAEEYVCSAVITAQKISGRGGSR
jgi:SAM-dependent methyltransferase